MNERLKERIAEEWAMLDPVDPLRRLLSDVIDVLSQPAQPAQEPVAWAVYHKRGGSKSLHWPENHSPNGDATMFDAVPLVPQRPWVGLTDEEREYWIGCNTTKQALARAIDNALKAKNT